MWVRTFASQDPAERKVSMLPEEMRLPERNCRRVVIMARAAEERPASVLIYRVIIKPANPRGHELLIMRVWYDGPSQAWWSGDVPSSRVTPDMCHRWPGENRLRSHSGRALGKT